MIVIPMAGLSSRFFKEGYTQPKFMLKAHGKCLFDHALVSFEKYFKTEKFLFIVRDNYDSVKFVRNHIKALGIKNSHVYILDKETRGQAETVALSLYSLQYQGPLAIFNIDTFRPHFQYPDLDKLGVGYLEVFEGDGDNWSFVKPMDVKSTRVIMTAEKTPISALCCTGLYYFSTVKHYLMAYENYLAKPSLDWEKGELYVAPLYNYLISIGLAIHYHLIERKEVIFCGIVSEYLDFLEKPIN